MAIIKNINGTSDLKCKCGSWLDHWKNFSKQVPQACSEKNCGNTDLVGAHVQKDSSLDQAWYIIPLCQLHNKSKGPLEIVDWRPLIPANKKLTCEKS